jgi:tetratricopeptide (TPR) repeat protein
MTPGDDTLDGDLFSSDPSAYANQPGQTIGPYTLCQKLGEGGFGLVWRAEQTTPIRRQVALKVIKVGMDTLQVVARFNVERQTLALMDHPGIASVYDAGTTSTGRPYFVMELVHGLPITTYCEQRQLSLPDRLRLFVDVCKAVQHAHQKGILHRDLKPPNIMVIDIDGTPQPKIIDFGIAKALESASLPESQLATRGDILLGTPDYMSPEQAVPGNPDLDTRTDIYALGVVLHEMLTGQTPQSMAHGKTSTLLGRLQHSPHTDLKRPSSLAKHPQEKSTVPDFTHHLKGDLDWILLKALAHNRSDRYASADAFAADILNHLADRPITAGKPSSLLTATKFIRRNRVVVLGASALFLILAIATALTSNAYMRESRMRLQADQLRTLSETQTQKAEQTLDFLTQLLQRTGEHVKNGKNPEALRLALEELQSNAETFSSDPEVNQAIAGRTALIFRALRSDSMAHPLFEQQLKSLQNSRPPDDPEILTTREEYARTLYLQGQYTESHRQFDELVRYWQSQLHTKDGPRRLYLVRRKRADVWAKTGRLNEALLEFDDIRSTATDETRAHSSWPVLLRTHADALITAGKFDDAEQTYLEVLRDLPMETPEQKHNASTIYQSRSTLLVKKRDIPAAITSLQKAIDLQTSAKGTDSPSLSDWRVGISRLLTAQDRNAEAIAVTQVALDAVSRTAQSERIHLVHRALADNYEAAGLHEQAAASFDTSAKLKWQMNPIPNEAWLDRSRFILNSTLCGKFSEANAAARTMKEILIDMAEDPEMNSDRSQIETALAFMQAASTEARGLTQTRASILKTHQLGIPLIEQFRIEHGQKPSSTIPHKVLTALERATKPRNNGPSPTSADLLALNQALNDRWLGSDPQGDLLQLAAALRVTGQLQAAVTLYEFIATMDPSLSPVRSRHLNALILAAETWLQLGDKKSANAILTRLDERHRSGQETIANPALLQRMTTLLTTGDPRPFKLAPQQTPSPIQHQQPKDASPMPSPSEVPKPDESALTQ